MLKADEKSAAEMVGEAKERVQNLTPREFAEQVELDTQIPDGDDERFAGYGVMGLPFGSGHVLGLRRFPASSISPGYTSVWHRNPEGRWTFYSTVAPLQGCDRYFGGGIDDVEHCDILIDWTGPRSFSATIGGGTLKWDVVLASTPATRAMNAVGSLIPAPLWRRRPVLSVMGAVAGQVLRVGRVGLQGKTPNGQWFMSNPRLIWSIKESAAVVRGEDLGSVGPVPKQARLGDFWIPQRGLFAFGAAFFQNFDSTLHLAATSQPRN